MNDKKKYRVTFEIVVDVETEDPEKVIELAEEEREKLNYEVEVFVEEI